MRIILLLLFGFFLTLTFCSCNNPLNKTYNTSTYLNDITEIRESNKVSYEDIELLTKYITLSKLAGKDLEGKTYEDILNNLKDIRQTNTDQNNRIQLEKDAMRERLGFYLTVNLSDKVFSKVTNKDCFIYTVTFQNLSGKNIQMVVGSISLNDLLDKEIKNIPVVLDEELRAGSFLKKTYVVEYDHSNENDKRIRSKELVDLRALWNPDKIIFKDGTVAE
ncbi:MAG TPA: hypothetical protein VMY77_17015 [Chitinophagaceae bacterium]|nr:hypothetical protein [Chitinophagaceae bacterium]